ATRRRRLARGRPVLPRFRADRRRPTTPRRGRDDPAFGQGRDAAGEPAPPVLRLVLLHRTARGRRPGPGWGRGDGEPDLLRLGLRAGRERAPSGLHGRARLPLDRRRALRPGATGAAPQGSAAPALPAPIRPALNQETAARTATMPLVDCAFAGVSTPSSHARGSSA